MNNKIRFSIALIFTPILSSLILGVVEQFPIERISELKLIIGMLPIFSVFTFLGLIVFGLPVYFLLKKLKRLNLINLTLAGGISGAVYMLIFQLMLSNKPYIDISSLLSGSVMGAMTALIFGLIARVPLNTDQ